MSSVVVNAAMREKLLSNGGEVEVRDESGEVIGAFIKAKFAAPLRREPGLARGMITILRDDDEHLTDFEEYMA
jgi:hypothetical protein